MTQPDEQGWRRTSPWGIGTRLIKAIPSLIPALIGFFFLGRAAGPIVVILAVVGVSALVGLFPWLTARWRLTEHQLEFRHGLIKISTATARRDRIRSVDVTASPVERILGLRKVVVGTGIGGEGSAVVLDPIPVAIADELGRELLRRAPVPAEQSAAVDADGEPLMPASVAPGAGADDEVLARLRPAWLRFAPFSATGFAVVAAAVGIGFRFVDEAGLMDRGSQLAQSWFRDIVDLGAAVLIPAAVLIVIVLAIVVSVLAYIAAFWGFTLTRRADGALHTTRGLLSTTAATIERKRVRGVQLHEPILMRIPGGAKLRAIATGTNRNPVLMPPAPRAEAIAVANEVLERPGVAETRLNPHGPAALRRRYTRAFVPNLIVAAVLAGLALSLRGWWTLPVGVFAVLIVLLSVVVARVRYAHLGSTVGDDVVVLGAASIGRTRTVLENEGVIGFVTTQTFFQRRAGVQTLTVATAAGGFDAVDVTAERVVRTALAVNPSFVAPFATTGERSVGE